MLNSVKSFTKLNAKAIFYILKEKRQIFTFIEIAFRNLNISSNYNTPLIPSNSRTKLNTNKYMILDNKT
ncbi:hypothetical protein RhiirA5_424086 [Rhizophagus irregularis]|uniref:Uncharacterized protein n=1 Tax=Rhizophagus irregularis TaxID=588596 RepID=A0A2I1F123_9GLOM|nr:hypothetical protein RhiirA5_424086 [Rhizophagus irregularis]PKC52744.1 hypothetical protein RhiirA1_480780 [Rhizophagus irregularis]PKY28053.1 hypothetical protein RhiirB3_444036 [Rhizophagus irregularis]